MTSDEALKAKVIDELEALGYEPSPTLPLPLLDMELRPAEEIAARQLAMTAVFAWVIAPPHEVPDHAVKQYIDMHDLAVALSDEEQAPLEMSRAEANSEFGGTIGWKLENMWSLLWVLGFEPAPGLDGARCGEKITRALLFEFIKPLVLAPDDVVAQCDIRSREEVVELEYRFYCAHHTVRTAQFVDATVVPPGFDPAHNGRVIHERRHSLTWCLSPEVEWEDIDLSE